jgi:hypothetical protein
LVSVGLCSDVSDVTQLGNTARLELDGDAMIAWYSTKPVSKVKVVARQAERHDELMRSLGCYLEDIHRKEPQSQSEPFARQEVPQSNENHSSAVCDHAPSAAPHRVHFADDSAMFSLAAPSGSKAHDSRKGHLAMQPKSILKRGVQQGRVQQPQQDQNQPTHPKLPLHQCEQPYSDSLTASEANALVSFVLQQSLWQQAQQAQWLDYCLQELKPFSAPPGLARGL